MRQSFAHVAVLLGLAGCMTAAGAQTFPAHPIRLVVPYPAGGSIDFVARVLSGPLRAGLHQDVMVENVPGAAGAIGLLRMLGAPADGHELAIGTDSDAVLAPLVNAEVRYRPESFKLLGVVAHAPMVLVTGSGSSVPELEKIVAEGRPNNMVGVRNWTVGNYGLGSNAHLCADDLSARAGVSMVHVPYKGMAPLLQDLIGNHVQLACLPLAGPVYEQLQAGKLKPLAIATSRRDLRLPAVPTIDQAAGLSGFQHASWSGIVSHPSVPDAVVRQLQAALAETLRDAAFQNELKRGGVFPAPTMDAVQLQTFYRTETQRYRELADAWRARAAVNPR